jgi:hypothetical protein
MAMKIQVEVLWVVMLYCAVVGYWTIEISVSYHSTTWCYNPKDLNLVYDVFYTSH